MVEEKTSVGEQTKMEIASRIGAHKTLALKARKKE